MHRDREMCHRNMSQMLETRKRRKKLALRNEKWALEEEEKDLGKKHERKGLCSRKQRLLPVVFIAIWSMQACL